MKSRMLNGFKVERLPIPRKGERNPVTATIRDLKVGESVFFSGKKNRDLCTIAWFLKPKKFTTSSKLQIPEGEVGCRIWRIK